MINMEAIESILDEQYTPPHGPSRVDHVASYHWHGGIEVGGKHFLS